MSIYLSKHLEFLLTKLYFLNFKLNNSCGYNWLLGYDYRMSYNQCQNVYPCISKHFLQIIVTVEFLKLIEIVIAVYGLIQIYNEMVYLLITKTYNEVHMKYLILLLWRLLLFMVKAGFYT